VCISCRRHVDVHKGRRGSVSCGLTWTEEDVNLVFLWTLEMDDPNIKILKRKCRIVNRTGVFCLYVQNRMGHHGRDSSYPDHGGPSDRNCLLFRGGGNAPRGGEGRERTRFTY